MLIPKIVLLEIREHHTFSQNMMFISIFALAICNVKKFSILWAKIHTKTWFMYSTLQLFYNSQPIFTCINHSEDNYFMPNPTFSIPFQIYKKVVYFVQFLSDIFIIKFCNIRSFPRIFKDQTCVTRASLWPHITRHTRLVLLFICSFNFHLSHCRSIKADWALNRKWLQTATCHSIQI